MYKTKKVNTLDYDLCCFEKKETQTSQVKAKTNLLKYS